MGKKKKKGKPNWHIFCTFFCRCYCNMNFFKLHVLWSKLRERSRKNLLLVFLFAFFSLPLIFTLLSARISYLISPPAYHVVLPTKFVSFVFFFSRASSSLLLFFSLSSASLSPTFSFSLSPHSQFVDMTIYVSLILKTVLL